jgi:hypothetical protein
MSTSIPVVLINPENGPDPVRTVEVLIPFVGCIANPVCPGESDDSTAAGLKCSKIQNQIRGVS